MKIVLEQDKCIGCGTCAAICPKHFKMADDGKSELIEATGDSGAKQEKETNDIGCAKDASDSCPVQIIHIEK